MWGRVNLYTGGFTGKQARQPRSTSKAHAWLNEPQVRRLGFLYVNSTQKAPDSFSPTGGIFYASLAEKLTVTKQYSKDFPASFRDLACANCLFVTLEKYNIYFTES